MYDTEKRVELVKSECMNIAAERSGIESIICLLCVLCCFCPLWEL